MSVLSSRALTKIQSVALIAIVLVAAVGVGTAYMLWRTSLPPPEDIKIGVCADLDMPGGKYMWQGTVLAAEQINAQGGILGRNVTVVGEDDDSESAPDLSVATNALTKLITVDNADFIMSTGGFVFPYQDICSEHKKILFSILSNDAAEQRVLDNYEKYKYYFTTLANTTATVNSSVESLKALRDYTGFNKVAYIDQDASTFAKFRGMLNESLVKNGFEVVYQGSTGFATTDFTSYFAAIEASGAEIINPFIVTQASRPFVKEWYERQSPCVIWGTLFFVIASSTWELLDGKCEYISIGGYPAETGYPLTNKTLTTREALTQRWGELPSVTTVLSFDIVRFILSDAIIRAGTTETEAVINALEATDVETSLARHLVFTSSHGIMVGQNYQQMCMFQWQNGTQAIVYPEQLKEQTGATYKYPPWQGPWSK